MHTTPLPPDLGAVFSVADAIRAGVSRGRLRATDLAKPFHGVRAVRAHAPRHDLDRASAREASLEHIERAVAFATRMPHTAFFSHVTAAVLWGLPLPPGLLRRPLDVGVVPPACLPRASGVRGHEVQSVHADIRCLDQLGLPVASPASTWAMLGAVRMHPYDLVAVGDAVVRTWRTESALATKSKLAATLKGGRRVGAPALRLALPRIRTRSASRPETHARLTLLDAGLREPALNDDVYDGEGRRLLCGDLVYRGEKVVIEYEGGHHLLDPRQWALDIRRAERLHEAGWTLIRVTSADLFGMPGDFVARVRRALASARGRA